MVAWRGSFAVAPARVGPGESWSRRFLRIRTLVRTPCALCLILSPCTRHIRPWDATPRAAQSTSTNHTRRCCSICACRFFCRCRTTSVVSVSLLHLPRYLPHQSNNVASGHQEAQDRHRCDRDGYPPDHPQPEASAQHRDDWEGVIVRELRQWRSDERLQGGRAKRRPHCSVRLPAE